MVSVFVVDRWWGPLLGGARLGDRAGSRLGSPLLRREPFDEVRFICAPAGWISPFHIRKGVCDNVPSPWKG